MDAAALLEPWNTLILDKVPGSYVVKRGGALQVPHDGRRRSRTR